MQRKSLEPQWIRALDALDLREVQALVAIGADVRVGRGGFTSLMRVAASPKGVPQDRLLALLQWLLDQGVDPDVMTEYGESALRLASRNGHFDAVHLLLKSGADASQLQLTSLHRAVLWGAVADVAALVAKGADLEARDTWSRTPYLLAIQAGHVDKVNWLREHGADAAARGRCGMPPLFYAVQSQKTAVLDWLLDAGEDIDQMDDFGTTPLFEAVEADHLPTIRRLIERGAALEVEVHGDTALGRARSAEAARTLLAHGAQISRLTGEVARRLLGLGAEPDESALDCSSADFEAHRVRVFPAANAARITNAYYLAMIRSGVNAYQAWRKLGRESSALPRFGPGAMAPVWCAQRFGQSLTFLPDGRIVQIGGEHEDGYDPDFCIYNDVFVHWPEGRIEVFGYPREVFQPTDFHSATLVGSDIYIIGCLGYAEDRRAGHTPVYRLDTHSLEIEEVPTHGEGPGWLSRHDAKTLGAHEILVHGGEVMVAKPPSRHDDGAGEFRPNDRQYVLDTLTSTWRAMETEWNADRDSVAS